MFDEILEMFSVIIVLAFSCGALYLAGKFLEFYANVQP